MTINLLAFWRQVLMNYDILLKIIPRIMSDFIIAFPVTTSRQMSPPVCDVFR